MKKLVLCVFVLAILLSSCASAPKRADVVYDASVPLEESFWIISAALGKVIAYNEIAIDWKTYQTIQIPAGNTLLEIDVNAARGNTIYKGKGILFQYDFQPGKLYQLWLGEKENVIGVDVCAWDFGEKIENHSEHLEGFVPFLNVGNNTPTVLN
jgi:hypothetical protein